MEERNRPISHLSWGNIAVNLQGKEYKFKDCKIWPEGAAEWDWNETGTSHESGIQPGDIEEILSKGVEVMVLSRGMDKQMKVAPETEEMLKSRGIEYHIQDTEKAVELFNSLYQKGKRAGGIFHSTC